MKIIALILLGLLALTLGTLGVLWVILHRAKKNPDTVSWPLVDGKQVRTFFHFGHWLPQRLGVLGFAMHGHIWMYYERVHVDRLGLAHEVVHRIQEHLAGSFRYTLRAAWEWATQWVWRRREMEIEARSMETILALSPQWCMLNIGDQTVEVRAPFLEEFTT